MTEVAINGPVHKLACDCEDLFAALISQRPGWPFTSLIADCHQRFAKWNAFLGVSAQSNQSLDHRLRNLPDIQDILCRLLDSLGISLTLCLSLRESDDFVEYEQPEHESQCRDRPLDEGEALTKVEDTLERLNRLGVTIRQFSQTSLNYLPNTSAQKGDAGSFDDLFVSSIEGLYPKAHPSLKRLLRTSMSQRHDKMISLNVRKRESSSSRKRGRDIEGAAALSAARLPLGAAVHPSHQPPARFSPAEDTNELLQGMRAYRRQIPDNNFKVDVQTSHESGLEMSNYSEQVLLTSSKLYPGKLNLGKRLYPEKLNVGKRRLGKQHAHGIDSGLASMEQTKPQAVPLVADTDDDEDDDGEYLFRKMTISKIDSITHDFAGFRQLVTELNPTLTDEGGNYLADRIAHQQVVRYNHFLDLKQNHTRQGVNCVSGSLCVALGGSATVLGQNVISAESFPPGIPMPPTQYLPAELECQLCYQKGLFWEPSDWTKHVYQDVKPFTCTWENCKRLEPFENKADWVRHENEGHRHLEWWTCDVEDCQHSCFRQENFLQHLVREHKLTEPKGKNKKRTGDIEPALQKMEQCHQKRALQPGEEPCKFCGRTFSTWKTLFTHLAKHMTQISLLVLLLVEAKAKQAEADLISGPAQDPSIMCGCCAKPLDKCDLEPDQRSQNTYEDMKPYICLVEECPECVSGYATFQEWSDHMENHSPTWNQELYQLPTWICAICERREVTFSGPEDLFVHMKQLHANCFSEKQLNAIAYRSRIFKRRPSNECFLCERSIQEDNTFSQTISLKQEGGLVEMPKAKRVLIPTYSDGTSNRSEAKPSSKPQKAISRHVASHLQALMSLTMHIVSTQQGTGSQDDSLETTSDDAVMTDPYGIGTDNFVSVINEVPDIATVHHTGSGNHGVGLHLNTMGVMPRPHACRHPASEHSNW